MIKIEKKENVAANARGLYDFRNKIINKIKKEIGEESKETKEDGKIEKLKLHRSEEELLKLTKDIEEDDDLDKGNNIKYRKNNLLKFLNSIKIKEISDENNAKSDYLNFLKYKESLGRTQNGSRADRIKNFINRAEYIIFGPLFNPKLDIATGEEDDRRRSVIETISKLGDKEEPTDIPKLETEEEAEKKIKGTGLKIMTPS